MYKRVETTKEIFMESAAAVAPIVSMQDEYGAKCHIIEDDHCYVLVQEYPDGVSSAMTHIFPEAFEVLKTLPPLNYVVS